MQAPNFISLRSQLTEDKINQMSSAEIASKYKAIVNASKSIIQAMPPIYKKSCHLFQKKFKLDNLPSCEINHPRIEGFSVTYPLTKIEGTDYLSLFHGLGGNCIVLNFAHRPLPKEAKQNLIKHGEKCVSEIQQARKAVISLPKTVSKVRTLIIDGQSRYTDYGWATFVENFGAEDIKQYLHINPNKTFQQQGIPLEEAYNFEENEPEIYSFDMFSVRYK